jgi:hypothetical protein
MTTSVLQDLGLEVAVRAAARAALVGERLESATRPVARTGVQQQALEVAATAASLPSTSELVAEVAAVPEVMAQVQSLWIEVLRKETASSGNNATGYDAFGDQAGPEDDVGVFAFRHDWSQPLVERLEWKTFVQRVASGNEQRQALRMLPRRSLRYTVGNGRRSDALVTDWLADHMGRKAWWPEPQLVVRLKAPAQQGDWILQVDDPTNRVLKFLPLRAEATTGSFGLDGWWSSDFVVWIDAPDGWQVARIDDMEPGLLWLVEPLARSVPVGSAVMPLTQGTCVEDSGAELFVPGGCHGEVSAVLQVQCPPWYDLNAPTFADDAVLDELPVWPDGNWRDSPRASASAAVQQMDTSLSDAWIRRADPVRNLTLERRYLLTGPDALTTWMLRLWAVQGQFGSLWLPDGIAPVMTVLEDADIASGYLAVDGAGMAAFWHRPAACAIYDPSGAVRYALTGPLHSGVPQALVLRSPLEGVVNAGARIVRLQRCRLAHDVVDLLWHSDAVVEIALSFLTLPEPRGNDRTSYYEGGYA